MEAPLILARSLVVVHFTERQLLLTIESCSNSVVKGTEKLGKDEDTYGQERDINGASTWKKLILIFRREKKRKLCLEGNWKQILSYGGKLEGNFWISIFF